MTNYRVPVVDTFEWQRTVLSKELIVPPETPAKAERYLIYGNPSGLWIGQQGKIAECDGTNWFFIAPYSGMTVFVEDESLFYIYTTSWQVLSSWSGYSGYSGSGVSGYSGYSGYDGTSGYSGYSGDNPGSSGWSGYSGYSGTSGYSGAQGISGFMGLDARIPIGTITAYAAATAPNGWLLCDGTAVSRTTYSELFTVIGTAHGVGDNTTTFNLPDLRDKFVRGKGATSSIGNTGGADTHSHAFGVAIGTGATNARETGDTLTQDASPVTGHMTVDHYHTSSVSGDTGTGSSLPSYLVEVFIIKAIDTSLEAFTFPSVTVKEADGNPSVANVTEIRVSGATVTEVSAGIATITVPAGGGGGSPLTVKEDDGTPSVATVTELRFSGATVTDNGAGAVTVTVTAGGGATSPASALYLHSTFGGF